jgi:hypothetical protein
MDQLISRYKMAKASKRLQIIVHFQYDPFRVFTKYHDHFRDKIGIACILQNLNLSKLAVQHTLQNANHMFETVSLTKLGKNMLKMSIFF